MAETDGIQEAKERIAKVVAEGGENLNLMDFGLTSLDPLAEDLAQASSVIWLDLDGNPITDLTPLARMTGLTGLDLSRTQITNISPIAGMTGITSLNLSRSQITDIAPIAGMTGITELYLEGTQITNIAPIAGMTGITELYLSSSQITDISPIAGMTGMTTLDLRNTPITDITPIAGLTGITSLVLSGTQITDISPVARVTEITRLYLSNTRTTDISPIARMTGITRLSLSGTQITDLRPLSGLTELAENPTLSGLQFKNTPACTLDPKIAEIAEVADAADRARQLFAYLENWVPPGEGDNGFDPDDTDLLPSTIVDGRLETALSQPTEAEIDDHLKRVMHQRLHSDLQDLADAASNQYPKTFQKACRLRDRLKPDFEDLDMLNIHLDVEALKQMRLRGQESDLGEPFPQDVLDAFDAVSASGPGLTLDNPDVEKLILKILRFKEDPLPQDAQEKHDALSQATASDEAAIGENLRTLERRTDEAETPAEKMAVQEPLHRGMVVRLGRWALSGGTIVIGAVALDLAKAPLVAYVQSNLPLLWDVAGLYGAQFQMWFGMALSEMKEFAGPLAAIEFKPSKRRKK